MTLARRDLLLGGGAALLVGAAQEPKSLGAIERDAGGRLGVHARDLVSGRVLAYRADERFMLFSTFKGVLAAMALAESDAGRLSLDEVLRFSARDMLPASPVTAAHLRAGRMTVRAACEAVTAVSDNAAANLLLARLGGPAGLTRFVRRTGDLVTRFDRYEVAAGVPQGVLDTTTPNAIAATFARLLTGDVLSAGSRRQLEAWMAGNRVGGARLKAAFPAGWSVADRTGTGDGYCNDVAFVRPPAGGALVVAAYHEGAGMSLAAQEAALSAVGGAVLAWHHAAGARGHSTG